jgi:hypothetical protein
VREPEHPPGLRRVVDKVIGELGALRQLVEVTEAEIGGVVEGLWGAAGESTWNRNRAVVSSWLTWCRDKQRWSAPAVPSSCERRKEHTDATKDLAKSALELVHHAVEGCRPCGELVLAFDGEACARQARGERAGCIYRSSNGPQRPLGDALRERPSTVTTRVCAAGCRLCFETWASPPRRALPHRQRIVDLPSASA